jgi:hypothetical protein
MPRSAAESVNAEMNSSQADDFVERGSIVRTIWGNADMVLLVFAGGAAEFALNRAVDWLFFTGKLPADPIGRLFSTASYAQQIVFADKAKATAALTRIRNLHSAVERQRGQTIPAWAHRDVLYMLIDYSERAHELLARPLTAQEKADLYDVFYRVGVGLGIPGLPSSYDDWRLDRQLHLERDLVRSTATDTLYSRYRDQLGAWRFGVLLKVQSLITPQHVRRLLDMRSSRIMRPLLRLYPLMIRAGLRSVVQQALMPAEHLQSVRALDYRGGCPFSSRHGHDYGQPERGKRSRIRQESIARAPHPRSRRRESLPRASA